MLEIPLQIYNWLKSRLSFKKWYQCVLPNTCSYHFPLTCRRNLLETGPPCSSFIPSEEAPKRFKVPSFVESNLYIYSCRVWKKACHLKKHIIKKTVPKPGSAQWCCKQHWFGWAVRRLSRVLGKSPSLSINHLLTIIHCRTNEFLRFKYESSMNRVPRAPPFKCPICRTISAGGYNWYGDVCFLHTLGPQGKKGGCEAWLNQLSGEKVMRPKCTACRTTWIYWAKAT